MNADVTDTDQDLDPGNDPDSVGSGEQIPERALKAVGANPGAKHEGSVKTLIEDQKDLEIASVALNAEQVSSSCNYGSFCGAIRELRIYEAAARRRVFETIKHIFEEDNIYK